MNSPYKKLNEILDKEKPFRRKQVEKAWFDVKINSYQDISTLPQDLKNQLTDISWQYLAPHTELVSSIDNTRKILFKLWDENFIETVIMGRKNLKDDKGENRERYTICISCQAGCPMKCAFCATGRAGFKRNLTAEEIVEQIRYCYYLLAQTGDRINNIVIMGQGEPLLNYDNVKKALQIILANTDIGPTKITVSTAGVIPVMEQLINDKDFPPVRWAISLHSAIEESRKKIMPSHKNGFLDYLVEWTKQYRKKMPSRTQFIGLEYIMLGGINDDQKHLDALIKLCKRIPHLRINLIPYNSTGKDPIDNIYNFDRTPSHEIERWHKELMKNDFTSTIRYSQGQDIAAACGQLRNTKK
ncbi:MAG: 23S rRNA (adenine(2503)-C(2))-methyltransferase RlmN [Patescibacteria group bacterium]|jgi:23S rRNA (adenine2503-C2)-methyltransferase